MMSSQHEFPKNSGSSSYEMDLEECHPNPGCFAARKDSQGVIELANSTRVMLSTSISQERSTQPHQVGTSQQLSISSFVELIGEEINSVTLVSVGNQVFRIANRMNVQNTLLLKPVQNEQPAVATTACTSLTKSNLKQLPDHSMQRKASRISSQNAKRAEGMPVNQKESGMAVAGVSEELDCYTNSRKTSDTSIQSDATQKMSGNCPATTVDSSRYLCARCHAITQESDSPQKVIQPKQETESLNVNSGISDYSTAATTKVITAAAATAVTKSNKLTTGYRYLSNEKSKVSRIGVSCTNGGNLISEVSTPKVSAFVIEDPMLLMMVNAQQQQQLLSSSEQVKHNQVEELEDEDEEKFVQGIKCDETFAELIHENRAAATKNNNKKAAMIASDDENESDSQVFTDEKIARTEKKNVVKNFAKAFISEVRRNPHVLLDGSSSNINNAETNSTAVAAAAISKRVKKFESFMKKSKYNHQFMKQLLGHAEYGNVFAMFLLGPAEEWLVNSQVKNKLTHRQMLTFFQQSIEDTNQLDKLKVLKKNKRKGVCATHGSLSNITAAAATTTPNSYLNIPSIEKLASLQHFEDFK